jgi:hypothetical protein
MDGRSNYVEPCYHSGASAGMLAQCCSARDVRDTMARRRYRWRDVGFAGMAGGDREALVMVTHDGVDQCEVLDVLHRRWPHVVLKDLAQEEPTVAMTAEDATDLGRCRRGVEPLRIVVMSQYDRQPTTLPYRLMDVDGSAVCRPVTVRDGTTTTLTCQTTLARVVWAVAPIRPVHKSPR